MKKATFTFKTTGTGCSGYFKCTKSVNSTKYLPGDLFTDNQIKKMVIESKSNRLEEIILVA